MKKRGTYPQDVVEFGVAIEYLDEIRERSRPEAKKALHRILDEAYRKGYEAGQKEEK